jgi:protoporphyrinogen IX oxidase
MTYGVVKSLHIISMVAWMAGMLYLPRLFVYHSQLSAGSEARATFETMERRLLRAIMLPAMLGTFIFGIWLATLLGVWSQGWLHTKLTLVVLLGGMHGFLSSEAKRLARGGAPRAARFYRIVNEVPTLILILVVFLVVLKPF